MSRFDCIIIGAGIAGAGLASFLAGSMRVALIEAEARPGYHATGRSAAFWTESYGGPSVQPLTSASGPWLASPPADFSEHGFLSPRGALTLASEAERPLLEDFIATYADTPVRMERYDRQQIAQMLPGLSPDIVEGVYEPDCRDIDVAGLHQAYLRRARRDGAELICNAPLRAGHYRDGLWQIEAGSHQLSTPLLVNAAGAWVDQVADILQRPAIGITPYRRTIVQLRTDPAPSGSLPLIMGVSGDYYFKPENGRLWLSPHDETPSAPCDAAPEEMDVALAIDRFQRIVDWRIEALEHRWAGLRSFAPDRLPVCGFADQRRDYFILAGQGGYGIQTSPALSMLAAQQICGSTPNAMTEALDAGLYAPARLFSSGNKATAAQE